MVRRIISFLERASHHTISRLDDKLLTTFKKSDDIVFIAQLDPRDDHIDVLFKDVAEAYRDRASFGVARTSGATTIICYNNKDDESEIITDLFDIVAIPRFVKTCLEPLIGEFTRVTEVKYLQVHITTFRYGLFFYSHKSGI